MKHILITGSTDGIGKLTALQLAKEGHNIYLHGRSPEKLAHVVSEIKELSKNGNVKGFVADFSDLATITNMTEQMKNEGPKLDVLINNAGILKSRQNAAPNGIDIRLTVNYLAPYVLTNQLLPLLKKADDARIINLSSAAQAPVSMTALKGKVTLGVNDAYAQSKLALTMWSFDLAAKEPDLTVIAVNPGSLLNTKMAKEAYGQYWAPADKGANLLVKLAIADHYKNDSGKYFDNDSGVFAPAHSEAYDQAKIEALIVNTNNVLDSLQIS
ncbi:SDR family NAD(P)-dependent oxidoreductase [Arenibacter aquaticus]|uniref:SDR family NAD(P)-dependent oxidoreductase n=1 Tax=Arenibacter aquaticus TaxID=2489054 RepID=A0A3S0IK53_9FLAO|nr:SDR family NAD(P)-dependent oxidoreductase [Arenibacter aquaticus]RTE52015.1 SDR family NAD(P)-dependent oxidoreductase [Arenibacter aquaticus]